MTITLSRRRFLQSTAALSAATLSTPSLALPQNNTVDGHKALVVIFLHGGISSNARSLTRRAQSLENFYMPENDEYIIAAPIKLGIDWSPKRIQDVVNDIQSNMKINNKIYLLKLKLHPCKNHKWKGVYCSSFNNASISYAWICVCTISVR